jgi:hypothetical protein
MASIYSYAGGALLKQPGLQLAKLATLTKKNQSM